VAILTANSAQSLTTALKAAKAGDTILLDAGNYSNVQIKGLVFDGNVTIASKDPGNPATLTGLVVSGSEGLTFQNLHLDFSSPWTVWNSQITDSENIEFRNMEFHGSLNNNPSDDESALLIRNSSDVRITGSEFHELAHGVSMMNSNGVRIEGNSFHDMRADGVISAGTSNVQVVGNVFTNFYPAEGDHPDAIQFLTRGTTEAAHDIVVDGNLITRGEGGIIQGVFITDQIGIGYLRVTVTDNVVVGGMYNGIMVANVDGLVVDGNTVAAYADMNSWIRINNSTNAQVTNNESMVYNLTGTTGTNSGNAIIPKLTVEQVANVKAWLIANGGETANLIGLLEGGAPTTPTTPTTPTIPTTPTTPTVPTTPTTPTEPTKPTEPSTPTTSPKPTDPVVSIPDAAPLVVVGTTGADRLTASGKADMRLEGGGGNDVLTGGAGANTLVGGAGDDVYQITDGDDLVVESANGGIDTVQAFVDYALTDNVENLKMLDGASVGVGNALANDISGTSGSDSMSGLGGDDVLRGREGNDTLSGGDGADRILGDDGNDRLEGGAGADSLYGSDGGDVLVGGDGNDRLEGGPGADTLNGGAGADSFVFRPTDLAGVDRIEGFSSGQGDRILLAELDANVNTAANDKFTFIGSSAFSGKAGELRFQVINGDAHVYGDMNGDRVADFEINVVGVSKLTSADFML
jgi:Ca2+-binding RTX toxin-like protein